MNNIPEGYCQCGCGQLTKIAKQSRINRGWIKGKPLRFCANHKLRGQHHHNWKGGIRLRSNGYVLIWQPDHPRANCQGYVQEHILVAESVIREYLPKDSYVHHINSIPFDNRKENLVICQNHKYHMLIHQRIKAFNVSGYANWLKCKYCKSYDDPKNIHSTPSGLSYHYDCRNKYRRKKYVKKSNI